MDKKTKPTVNVNLLDKIVSDNVRRLREALKLTQEDMAELMECSKGQIGLLEAGDRPWKTIWILKASKALKVKPEILLTKTASATGLEAELQKTISHLIDAYNRKQALEDEISKKDNK